MKSNPHFYDTTPTIFNIVSTLFLSPHPLYWWYHTNSIYEISSSLYVDIISIVYNNIFTIFVPSQPLYVCLISTLSMISWPLYIWHCPTMCLTLETLYKVSHPQFMPSRHIIYDITGTVFMSSLPRYLTLYPQYLCPHNPPTYDLWKTVCMTSHSLDIWHLMHQI